MTITGTTNVDFIWTIYDNDGSPTGETDDVSDANDFKIEFDKSVIYGWRNYSIYFDAGAGGARWYNSSYFNYFVLSIEIPERVGDSMEIKGLSNVNCEWYIYNRDTSTWTGETDSIVGGNNYFQFLFTLQTASGKHNYSLYFNVSTSVYIWKNGSYYITPVVLAVSNSVYTATNTQNFLSGETNVACDWYAYNNDTEMDTGTIGVGSFAIDWEKNTTVGYYVWGIKFDDGTTERWVNGTFEISAIDVLLITDTLYSTSDDYLYLSGYTNIGCDWHAYNNNTQMNTGTIGAGSFEVAWAKNTTTGFYNWGVKFDDGTTTRWVNGTNEIPIVKLSINVEHWSAEDVVIGITGTSNLDMTWWIYNEGIYSIGETGTETADIGFHFTFAKNTTVGKHNFSIYFNDTMDGSQYRWFNRSYTISILYSYCSVVLYGPEGTGLNPILFKVLVNGTEHTSSAVTFYGGVDFVYNVTVLNYFDEVVGSDISQMPDDKIIRVSINVYTFKVYNQLDEEYIYFNMTSSGGAVWSEHIGPREIVKFILYSGNEYTYTFTALTGPDVGTFTGTVNVSADIGMIITGYSLPDIFAGFSEVGGGSDVTLLDIKNALVAQTGGLLNQIQFFTWITALMIFLGLYIIPYVAKQRKKGEGPLVIPELGGVVTYEDEYDSFTGATRTVRKVKKKKGPVPKQLKEHTFKEGMFNPQFKGTKALDEMGDHIWAKLRGERPRKGKE